MMFQQLCSGLVAPAIDRQTGQVFAVGTDLFLNVE